MDTLITCSAYAQIDNYNITAGTLHVIRGVGTNTCHDT